MGTTLGIVFALLGLIASTSSHSISWKDCPNPDATKPFDVDRFLGRWYLVQVTDHINVCMTMEFQKEDDSSIRVAQKREFRMLKTFNIRYKHTYTGKLKPKDASNPADMTVKWTANAISANFKVLDTDYDNYALVFECQQIWVFFKNISRQSFIILSRQRTLDEERIVALRAKVEMAGGDSTPMRGVQQTDCIPDDEAEVEFDLPDNENELESLLSTKEFRDIKDRDTLLAALKSKVKPKNL